MEPPSPGRAAPGKPPAPERVAVAVVVEDGRALVGRRRHPPLAGYAEFPGGRARPGERADAAAVREVREECGLEVRVERLLLRTRFSYPHALLDLHFFLCSPISSTGALPGGAARPDRPRPPFTWVSLSALAGLRFPAANADLVRTLPGLRPEADAATPTKPASARRSPPR